MKSMISLTLSKQLCELSPHSDLSAETLAVSWCHLNVAMKICKKEGQKFKDSKPYITAVKNLFGYETYYLFPPCFENWHRYLSYTPQRLQDRR